MVLGTLVTFVVSLLVGGLGIYVGARLVTGSGDYEQALVTAVLGSLGWTLIDLLVGWVPFLGGLLAAILGFVVYLGIIDWRYPGGVIEAAAIALVAWLAGAVVLFLVSPFVPGGVDAIGVAGV